MLFNSLEFIFLFLPITWFGFYYLKDNLSLGWLVLCSLFFYAYWNPSYLTIILASVFFNYWVGNSLHKVTFKKPLLIFGITVNLFFLGYYKYSLFLASNLNYLFDTNFHLNSIILPLAISFFTFQQIAYLVDAYRGEAEYKFLHYSLFVIFFPQLIAGPIVHHKEIIPQFNQKYKDYSKHITIGLTIFFIGLFKKVVIADNLSVDANLVFSAAENGYLVTFFEAWQGSLSYTLQLYFDFSGYADMAIGSARLFGIKLPDNFNSPYKSKNIIDFWRRWHMTLSRFLRDYIYIPLGGNRKGNTKKQLFIMITMVIGGLWHGANWTFVLWGTLHGSYLVINHLWQQIHNKYYIKLKLFPQWFTSIISHTITLIAVIYAWVFFRAESIDCALNIVKGLSGMNGIVFPEKYLRWDNLSPWLISNGASFSNLELISSLSDLISLFLILILGCLILPNTREFFEEHRAIHIKSIFSIKWGYNNSWALVMSLIVFISMANLGLVKEFIYFQF
ncbi:MAG: MBOAT family protein [Methylococcaceae bacterium]|nr:MBOAT family protein [Methylococcaceae bacterium]